MGRTQKFTSYLSDIIVAGNPNLAVIKKTGKQK